MGDRQSDEELMSLFCSGDKSAGEALYRRYRARVFTFLLRGVPTKRGAGKIYPTNREMAEDVHQTVWVEVFRAPERFDVARGSFKTYLFVKAAARLQDAVRKATRWGAMTDPMNPSEDTADGNIANSQPGPEELVSDEDLREKALGVLSSEQREAWLLHQEDFSYREIASIQGISPEGARTRLRRAKGALVDYLAASGE